MRLNLGCGRQILSGWVNVDRVPLAGVDVVVELDDPDKVSLPWADGTVDEFALSHVLEHIRHPLPLMAELWRVAKPDAAITVACPYGGSDDADEDPTHVRRLFLRSFEYFGQPFYSRADYGYRGDWRVDHITLDIPTHYQGVPDDEVMRDVTLLRNIVIQMTAVLRAVKPAREARDELIEPPRVKFRLVDRPAVAAEHVASKAELEATTVVVPVLGRPQNAVPFWASLKATAPTAQLLIMADRPDVETVRTWAACGANVRATSAHTFAEKVNRAAQHVTTPWMFICGDDVRFHPSWLEEAQRVARATGAQVVGTNDLGNEAIMRGEAANHLLIRKDYIDEQGASWDGPGVVCHEGYRHWFVDNEIVCAAVQRRVFAAATGSHVEHLHPAYGKAPMDATYEFGASRRDDDQRLFEERLARFVDAPVG